MSGKQAAVLWMGLILILLNVLSHWAEIKSVIFAGATGTSGGSSTTPPASINPASPGFRWPKLPSWIPTWPGTQIPLISDTTPNPSTTQQTSSTQLVLPMATTTKTADQPGYDIVVTTAVELIGVGLLSLLAGSNDHVGNIIIIIMAGWMLVWALSHTSILTKYLGISSAFKPYTG